MPGIADKPEAADAVILDTSLQKVDELLHINRRTRAIALPSAVGGMALSLIGMLFASAGALPPVAGALAHEVMTCWPCSTPCVPL